MSGIPNVLTSISCEFATSPTLLNTNGFNQQKLLWRKLSWFCCLWPTRPKSYKLSDSKANFYHLFLLVYYLRKQLILSILEWPTDLRCLHSFVLSLSYCASIGALSFDWCVIFPQSWPAVAVYKRRQQVFRLTYSSFFQQKYQKRIGEFKHQKKGHGDSPLLWFLVNDHFFLIFPPTRFIEYKFYGLQNSVAFQLIRAFPHCQSQRSLIYKKWKISQQ